MPLGLHGFAKILFESHPSAIGDVLAVMGSQHGTLGPNSENDPRAGKVAVDGFGEGGGLGAETAVFNPLAQHEGSGAGIDCRTDVIHGLLVQIDLPARIVVPEKVLPDPFARGLVIAEIDNDG